MLDRSGSFRPRNDRIFFHSSTSLPSNGNIRSINAIEPFGFLLVVPRHHVTSVLGMENDSTSLPERLKSSRTYRSLDKSDLQRPLSLKTIRATKGCSMLSATGYKKLPKPRSIHSVSSDFAFWRVK